MEKQRTIPIIGIELRAALDTVNHKIVLDILNNQFGISNTTLKWYDYYLGKKKLQGECGLCLLNL